MVDLFRDLPVEGPQSHDLVSELDVKLGKLSNRSLQALDLLSELQVQILVVLVVYGVVDLEGLEQDHHLLFRRYLLLGLEARLGVFVVLGEVELACTCF